MPQRHGKGARVQEGEVAGPRRRTPGLVCMLALALVLSGCGSGGGGPAPEPPVSPPPQPTGLTAEAGDGEVLLSWTAIAAATRWEYRQRIGDGAWAAWTTVPGSGSGTTEHTVADLESGQAYGFQVRAVNAGGAGPASAEAAATLVPPQPTDLTATAGDGLVELAWTAIATATGWEYRLRTGDGEWGEWTAVPESGQETAGHTVADLENGTAYGFQVRAVNAGGAGPASAEATATPVPPVPPQPADLTATAGDGLVELAWTAIATASGWEYRLRTGDGEWGEWTAVPESGQETAGHTVADLENGVAYGFQVRAVNAGGAGPASAEATATPVAPGVPVEIPDANLRRALEETLGKAPGETITDADLRTLSHLRAERAGIFDLTGLEYATGLELVYLEINHVSDVSPLAAATGLRHLSLRWNRVSDLASLANSVELNTLWLYGNEVEDVSALAGLRSLSNLSLGDNRVSDISPLAGLSRLRHLDLRLNRVSDLSPLEELRGLDYLQLQNNAISDLAPLSGLRALRVLALWSNDIVDVGPLSQLSSLRELSLGGGNRVEDISPLLGLAALEELVLDDNPVADPEALEVLGSLRVLGLNNVAALDDLSFLSDLKHLVHLRIAGVPAHLLSALSHLTDLEHLDIAGVQAEDLSPLAGLTALEYLDISGMPVEDLWPLAELESLRELRIVSLSADLSPLAGLSELRSVWQLPGAYIAGTLPKVDIEPLAGLGKLEVLAASPLDGDLSPVAGLRSLRLLELPEPGTPFGDLSPLAELTGLRRLGLRDGGVEDISALAGLAALETLGLGSNRIADVSPLSGLEALYWLGLGDNRIRDVAGLADNPGLGFGDTIFLGGNPLNADALLTHIPALESRDVRVHYDPDEFLDSPLRALHDDAVSMWVDADLTTAAYDLDFAGYAEEFIAHFGDGFDVLVFLSMLGSPRDHATLPYLGLYRRVSNDVRGIGLDPDDRNPAFGSTRLKGVVHLPYLQALQWGHSLHELMHAWANFGVATSDFGHWGFSSARGQLGGFRREDLADLGGGRWSAGVFHTNRSVGLSGQPHTGNHAPYAPFELYLAGLVGPEDVPDLWVAPEGRWTEERTAAGHWIFEAESPRTLTIDEFIEEHGAREPDHLSAPRELRGAVIVLEDDDHQAGPGDWRIVREDIRWLSLPRAPADGEFSNYVDSLVNYHQATGGRGRLVLDGLLELRRDRPMSRVPRLRLEQVCPPPGADVPHSPVDFRRGGDRRPHRRAGGSRMPTSEMPARNEIRRIPPPIPEAWDSGGYERGYLLAPFQCGSEPDTCRVEIDDDVLVGAEGVVDRDDTDEEDRWACRSDTGKVRECKKVK